jgi:hypothetical protein
VRAPLCFLPCSRLPFPFLAGSPHPPYIWANLSILGQEFLIFTHSVWREAPHLCPRAAAQREYWLPELCRHGHRQRHRTSRLPIDHPAKLHWCSGEMNLLLGTYIRCRCVTSGGTVGNTDHLESVAFDIGIRGNRVTRNERESRLETS